MFGKDERPSCPLCKPLCPLWSAFLRPREKANRKGHEVLTKDTRQAGLFAGDGHAFDAQRGTGSRGAKLKIVADVGDVAEHVSQVSGDGDLLDRESQLTARDPQAGGASREI